MSGGYITLHRKIMDWPLYKYLRGDQRHVVTTLLLLANWKPSRAYVAGHQVDVARGELLRSEATIATEAGCTRKVVRTTISLLVKDGFLEAVPVAQERARHVRKLKIKNYDRFQSPENDEGPRVGEAEAPARANGGPSVGQRGAPLEPGKPDQPVNHLPSPPAAPGGASPAVLALEGDLDQRENPERRKAKKPRRNNAAPADPRFQPFVDVFVRVGKEVLGEKEFVGKDGAALKRFLAERKSPCVDSLEARWRRSLAAAPKWPGTASIPAFLDRWDDFANAVNGTAKTKVTQDPSPASAFGAGGRVDL